RQQVLLWQATGALLVCEADTGKEVQRLAGHTGAVNAAVFSADAVSVFSAGQDGTVRQWDVKTRKEMRRFQGHTASVTVLAPGGDGSILITASSADRTLRLWDIATGRELDRTLYAGGPLSCSGMHLLSVGADNALQLWKLPARSRRR